MAEWTRPAWAVIPPGYTVRTMPNTYSHAVRVMSHRTDRMEIDTMASLQTTIRRSMVVGMVQRDIFCRYTGDVLDVRTCAVLIDSDGDPEAVLSPRAANMVEEDAATMATLASKGYRIARKGTDSFTD